VEEKNAKLLEEEAMNEDTDQFPQKMIDSNQHLLSSPNTEDNFANNETGDVRIPSNEYQPPQIDQEKANNN
jgi:hypothetical protein